MTSTPTNAVAARVRWAAASSLLLVAVAGALEAHGRASRHRFEPPPDMNGRRWLSAGDAAGAVRAWMACDLRGRRALVLTGRWSRPRTVKEGITEADLARAAAGPLDFLDADSALWVAATRGVVRALEVVMPPAALDRRLAEAEGPRGLVRTPGGFQHPFDAFERTFSSPGAYRGGPEPVLLLVEPSFLDAGAPDDLTAWLRERGVAFDLGVIALEDPLATAEQRARAAALAEALGAQFAEVQE
jgi:hypothetical protein